MRDRHQVVAEDHLGDGDGQPRGERVNRAGFENRELARADLEGRLGVCARCEGVVGGGGVGVKGGGWGVHFWGVGCVFVSVWRGGFGLVRLGRGREDGGDGSGGGQARVGIAWSVAGMEGLLRGLVEACVVPRRKKR